MPIRTNRGRAAVYRRLWGWPLRSPRHLVVSLVVFVVVAIAIAVVTAHATASSRHRAAGGGGTAITSVNPSVLGTATPDGSTGNAATTGNTTGGQPSATRLTGPLPPPKSAPPAPGALAVIDQWGKEWVNHPVGMTNAQWLAQLKPYTTDEFLPQMKTVDVSNIDATEITGKPTATNSYTKSVEALLPTNAGTLDITAVATPQGWQVSAYKPAS
jgi:hypothetical protein